MTKSIPVRIQKSGDDTVMCFHPAHSGLNRPTTLLSRVEKPEVKVAVEPRVEVREVNPGVFEVTVTCQCGSQSIIRCESLVRGAA